jgi:general nucleoside transport system permease protein
VAEPRDPVETTTAAGAIAFYERAGGFLVPLAATVLAFFIGGLVVLATGANPLSAYKAIFQGTGLTWFIPGIGDTAAEARDLQQTLIVMTPLILTALAVAFAFRCGMFNIGGQGQYWVGLLAALTIGMHVTGLPLGVHVTIAILGAMVAGAIWGGIAGVLKASVGAHEVISTIMLNWIAIWAGRWLVELGGPLQGDEPSTPRSNDIADSAKLSEVWNWGSLQPLHAGIFISLFALIVYHVLLNRTTLGFEVRAVGFNPEAARYGGISVGRNYFLALAISGSFAGTAGAMDMLGWKYHLAENDFPVGAVGFIGIAVALLGRNKAVGILFAALLFAALNIGTQGRQLPPEFPGELASNLATIIQALIILFVGAELLIVYMWRARKRIGFAGPRRVRPELKQ